MMSSPSPQTTYPPTSSIIILCQTYPVPAHPSDELISGQPLSESWGRTITRISIAVCLFLVLASLSHTFIIHYCFNIWLPVRGRLQRTSAKISDFQTTPLPLSGCVRISKTTPSPDVRVQIFHFSHIFQFLHIFIFAH